MTSGHGKEVVGFVIVVGTDAFVAPLPADTLA